MKTDMGFADNIVTTALHMGADETEVYAVKSRNLTVEVKKGKIDSLEKSVDFGYAIRIIQGEKQGFSYSTDPSKLSECIETAIETARWTKRDTCIGFPEKQTYQKVEIFDPAVDSLTENDLKKFALTVEESAFKSDKRITKTRKTSAHISSGEIIMMNSKGIAGSYRSTAINSHITVIAEEGGESRAGWDYRGSRFLEDIPFHEIGKTAAEAAIRLLGAQKVKPSRTFVILDGTVATEFLSIFASALSSEAVQKGKSLLKGKMGEQVISVGVDIVDNALMDKLSGSRPFDAEGVTTKNKILIEKGILKGFLYNTYTAKKEGVSSTGNAVRAGFAGMPSVGITNMYIQPAGRFSPEPVRTLVSSIDRGLFVTEAMGIHTANPISGDFSVGVTGVWIEGGSFLHPVKEAVISGNILDLFKNIMGCGDDLKFLGKIGSPSLLIQDVDISG